MAFGCYSGGPTFGDYITQNGGTVDEICGQIAQLVARTYSAGETWNACLEDQSSSIHIDVSVFCRNWFFSEYFKYENAKSACLTEANACDHGSEQNHDDFWYKIDPNGGTCGP